MPRLLIIGGSDGGISAALRARELDPTVDVSLLLADRYPNYSICGLPYFLSGDVPDWHMLAHRTSAELEHAGIEILAEHTAERIDAKAKIVAVKHEQSVLQLRYDTLVVATGAKPARPPIPGIDNAGVYQLHTIADSLILDQALAESPQRAAIVGAGYIGLEMAEALRTRGVEVTLIEQVPEVLPTVDPELGAVVRAELETKGVEVVTSAAVTAIEAEPGRLTVFGDPGLRVIADIVLVVVGVNPNSHLGHAAGIETGPRGALRVDRRMATNLPDIFAAGDCVTTYHRLLETDSYLPLGTTAHKQGRIAGENAVGGDRQFEGSLGTQVVKIFDLAAARTGLRDQEAQAAGLSPLTVASRSYDHKIYYPGAVEVATRVTGETSNGRLLGVQLVGRLTAEVPKRIDTAATAIYHDMTVDGLNDLDLSYTPPFGSPWDVLQEGAQDWLRVAAPNPVT